MLLKIFIKNINILPQLFLSKEAIKKVEKVEKGGKGGKRWKKVEIINILKMNLKK